MKSQQPTHSTLFVLTLILAMIPWVFQAPGVLAQETERIEKSVTVEVKDGRVYINGKEADREDGRIVIRKGDGDEMVVIVTDEDSVMVGEDGSRFMMRRSSPAPHSNSFVWFSHEDGAEENEFKSKFERDFEFEFRGDAPLAEYRMQMDRMHRPGDLDVFFPDGPDHMRALGESLRNVAPRMQMQSAEVVKREAELRALAREIRRADDASRRELEQRLDQKLQEAFELKMQLEQKQLAELKEQVAKLQARLEEREAARREIIDQRRRQLLGERNNWDW